MKLKNYSIVTKFTLFMLAFSLFLILFVVFMMKWIGDNEIEDNAQDNATVMAKNVEAILDQDRIRAQMLTRVLVKMGEANILDPNKISKVMSLDGVSDLVAGGGIWPEPYSLDPNKERASIFFTRNRNTQLLLDQSYNNPKTNPYFQESWYLSATKCAKGDLAWSEFYIDPYTQQPMITVSAPIHHQDTVKGVATIDVSLARLKKDVKRQVDTFGGSAFLMDWNGQIIVAPKAFETIKHYKNLDDMQPLYAPLVTILQSSYKDDKNSSITVAPIKHDPLIGSGALAVIITQQFTHWRLVVIIPQKVLYAQSQKAFGTLFWILTLVVGLLSVIAYFGLKAQFIKPIAQLQQELRTAGDESKMLSVNRNDEIGMLAQEFNNKTQQLIEINEHLEDKVNERTAQLSQLNRNIQSSIEYASLIQQALIPASQLLGDHFREHFSIWEPKDTVGGDVYLFQPLRSEDEWLLMVIDCTGHGVPGAFVTMLVKAIERQITSRIKYSDEVVSPAALLGVFNKSMKHLLKQNDINSQSNAGFDGAILYGNKTQGIVRYAGAQIPLWYSNDSKSLETIKADRYSVGYKKCDLDYVYTDHELIYQEGMQVYISTDGYVDQTGGENGFSFGKKKTISIIEENITLPMNEQKNLLLDALASYQGNEKRNDDITVIGLTL